MKIGFIILIVVLMVAAIVLLIKKIISQKKTIKDQRIEVLKERILKQEAMDLILHDAEVEAKVSAKVEIINDMSDDELIAAGNSMFKHPGSSNSK